MDKEQENIPQHIAIVMDGNGRWAKARMMPRAFGHKKGVDSVRAVIRGCIDFGVPHLTLFAFSSENWKRPPAEVSSLMKLFMTVLDHEAAQLKKNGIRLRVIGDIEGFSSQLQDKIKSVEALTAGGEKLTLNIAANYGGRWDIVNAAQKIMDLVKRGILPVDAMDEALISQSISTHYLPDPDLFIRTGGEQRISNFLLWQLAYAELYFTEVLWPEFNKDELKKAIQDFSNRQRRFGMTGEQVKDSSNA